MRMRATLPSVDSSDTTLALPLSICLYLSANASLSMFLCMSVFLILSRGSSWTISGETGSSLLVVWGGSS